jgi:hypothetical protein
MRPIDADALIEHMRKAYNKRISDWDLISTVAVIGAEEDAEPVRHGHWKYSPKDAFEVMFELPKCSVCGHESSDALNYCSNCGAKMEDVEEL